MHDRISYARVFQQLQHPAPERVNCLPFSESCVVRTTYYRGSFQLSVISNRMQADALTMQVDASTIQANALIMQVNALAKP